VLAHLGLHVLREPRARIDHREQHAADAELGIEPAADEVDAGGAFEALVLIFPGMIASIFLLVVLLKSYIKQPSDKEQR